MVQIEVTIADRLFDGTGIEAAMTKYLGRYVVTDLWGYKLMFPDNYADPILLSYGIVSMNKVEQWPGELEPYTCLYDPDEGTICLPDEYNHPIWAVGYPAKEARHHKGNLTI